MTGKSDNYQGRQTARKSSAERRIRILEATMRIIVRDGIRGVRHRAVAAEAEVPLAATTYYFEHINDLISDAFVLFYERLREGNRLLGETCYSLITQYSHDQLQHKETRLALSDHLAEMLTTHIENQVAAPDERILENAFFNEALHNPLLKELVDNSLQEIHWLIEKSLREIDSRHSATDARTILAIIHHLEYICTLAGSAEFNRKLVYKTTLRVVRQVMHCEENEVTPVATPTPSPA